MSTPCILIVDDDAALLQALPQALRLRLPEADVETCDSALVALERIRQTDFDVIITDIKMPGMDGLALLTHVRELRPDTPTLLITGHGDHTLTVEALRGGAYDFIQKPLDRDYLIASLSRAIQARDLRRQVEAQRVALEHHAATLERAVEERTRDLRAALATKDELLHARDEALAEARRATREQQVARRQVELLAGQLGEQATQLDAIFEAMVEAVYVCDAQARIVRVNARGAALLGLRVEQVLQPVERLWQTNAFHHLDGASMRVEDFPVVRALGGETQTDVRFFIRQCDTGQEIPVRLSSAPIRDDLGRITGAVAVASDISDLYRLERQKDEFLSIASHELKTPLTSLKGLAQITHRHLARSNAPEVTYVRKMERAIERMETLVNDLLDISRIESGKLALRLEPVDLEAVAQQVVDEQIAATERQIIFNVRAERTDVDADADRVGQVITNLLSNALKYSPAETPVVLTLLRNQSGDELVLAVRDQGPGIPASELPHIFERFYRAPHIEVRSGSGVGLGLGLYITREIVERHGGRIWAESALGRGSTFYVALPLARRLDDLDPSDVASDVAAPIQPLQHASGPAC